MKNKIIILAALLIALGVLGFVTHQFPSHEVTQTPPPETSHPVMCTMDAKICPDGSAVGRSGPKCEFAACPSSNTPSTSPVVSEQTSVGLNKQLTQNGVTISSLELLNDSRCPIDVNCIQAGTVRLGADVQSGALSQKMEFILGTPMKFSGKSITLVGVTPTRSSKKPIDPKDYLFEFLVQK